MDVREKLVELLDETFDKQYDRNLVITARNTADHLIANGVTVQAWISVKDRLPDKFGEYIVAVKTISGVVYSDYADYDYFQKRWTTGLYFDIGSKVTYWMPLPEPPKMEKGNNNEN